MSAIESAATVAFYVGLVALCAGAIFGARGTVEGKRTRMTIPLLIVGAVCIAAALVAYAQGPRQMLPF